MVLSVLEVWTHWQDSERLSIVSKDLNYFARDCHWCCASFTKNQLFPMPHWQAAWQCMPVRWQAAWPVLTICILSDFQVTNICMNSNVILILPVRWQAA